MVCGATGEGVAGEVGMGEGGGAVEAVVAGEGVTEGVDGAAGEGTLND